MNKMVAEVQAATQLLSKEKKNKKKKSAGAPNQYEYDSDEETEDGTWEHKARVSEMQKTKSTYMYIRVWMLQFHSVHTDRITPHWKVLCS